MINPARSSTRRCFEIAGWLMANGPCSSVTLASPDASRAKIARRVGSASAANVTLRDDGTLRNDLVALAIRIETLIITGHSGVIRPPRIVALALARYLWSLAPPAFIDDGSRGAMLFDSRCAGCHVPPGYSGPPVALGTVGSDPTVGLSADRGTGGYRVPSLRLVSTRGRLLHDGSIRDPATLLDPARLSSGFPGHPFGIDLAEQDRADLLAFLQTL